MTLVFDLFIRNRKNATVTVGSRGTQQGRKRLEFLLVAECSYQVLRFFNTLRRPPKTTTNEGSRG